MKLTIKYFGMIEEVVSKSEEIIEFQSTLSVNELKSKLESIYPLISEKNYQIAVNQNISLNNEMILENSEIALLPPFAGG